MATVSESDPAAAPVVPPGSRRALAWRLALAAPVVAVPAWVALTHAVPVPADLRAGPGGVLVLMLLTATVTDLLWRRIFNWTTYTTALWAAVLQALAYVAESAGDPVVFGLPAADFVGRSEPAKILFGLGIGFGLMWMLYVTAGGGGGDLKLVAAAGCFLGPERLLQALVYCYIAAGAFAAMVLVWKVGPVGIALYLVRKIAGPFARWLTFLPPTPDMTDVWKVGLPMAPFYAFGVVLAQWR